MANILNTTLWFIVALGVLVTIHEYGHFWVARRFGIKVLRFSIGFGNPLLRWHDQKGTEYWIASIPLGGYVKLLDAREADVPTADMAQEFSSRPVGQRLLVYVAGPAINLIFAVLLYWVLFVQGVTTLAPVIGQPLPGSIAEAAHFQSGDEIVSVDGKKTPGWDAVNFALIAHMGDSDTIKIEVKSKGSVVTEMKNLSVTDFMSFAGQDTSPIRALGLMPYYPEAPPVIGEVLPDSPAQRAGLRVNDVIHAANGIQIQSWMDWVRQIRQNPEQPLTVELMRHDSPVILTITPEAAEDAGQTIGRIGAAPLAMEMPKELLRTLHYGPLESLWQALNKTCERITLTFATLGKMLTGKVSVENLSGPITIAQVAGMTASSGMESFLDFLAYLSISLGILNLLPIPVLDGGHILYGLLEWVRGKPLSDRVQQVGLGVGLSLLAMFMALAFYNDIMRLTH